MEGLSGIPFDALLALSALFAIGSASPTSSLTPPRMEMPDSPPSSPPPPPSYWNFSSNGLPVSYRVAIIIDAFVLVVTVTSLCLLGWYMRKQYRRRKLLGAIYTQEEDGEGKLRGLEGGVLLGGVLGKKAGRGKRGHVRWGSQVQGGSLELNIRPTSMDMMMQKAEPSTPAATKKSHSHIQPQFQYISKENSANGGNGKAKNEGHHKLELDFLSMERLTVDSLRNGLKAKNSPMAKEFKGDPFGRGKDARVWDEDAEGHRKRSLPLLGEE